MAIALGFIGVEVGAGADDTLATVPEGAVGLVLLLPITGACGSQFSQFPTGHQDHEVGSRSCLRCNGGAV